MLFVARRFGQELEKDPDDWQDDFIIRKCQERNPEISVMQRLDQAAQTDDHIKRYLENIRKTMTRRETLEHPTMTVHQFTQQVEEGTVKCAPFMWCRKLLTGANLQCVADAFLNASDKLKEAAYLSVFTVVPYSYAMDPILRLARRRPNGDDRLTEFAIAALEHLEAPEIREFALDKLQRTRKPYLFTSLLKKNYQLGDTDLLTMIAGKYVNEDIIEALAVSYVDIYSENSTRECLRPLIALYRKMNCGIHRNSILKILIQDNVLPDDIRREMEFDSYEETRQLFRQLSR
jgi:hypothetical protein